MEWGDCGRSLCIFITDGAAESGIAICHKKTHALYEDISLPENWKQFIWNNLKLTPVNASI